MTARTKECLVIILDVREGNNKQFKEKAFNCAKEILKEKISADRKDMITFLLMGTKNSQNCLNDKTVDGYQHIVQYPEVQAPTWQLFCNFIKQVNEVEPGTDADWIDALIVALEIQNENEENFNLPHRRIMLFHDFDGSTKDFNEFQVTANSFLEKEIGLIVVSNKIAYITNKETSEPQAIFIDQPNKTEDQLTDERYGLRLVSHCNAELCNFEEAVRESFNLSNKRPWTWNGDLVIGTSVKIAISGVIAVKDENDIKLKKCWGTDDEVAKRELRTLVNGVEVDESELDIITGYMLGSTPIPFDEAVEETEDEHMHYEPGLRFLGFPKISDIPDEYFTGDSLYYILHRRGMTESAKKMDALVRAMLNTNRAMLCWKIYSAKFNTPKLVVLFPNEMQPDRPASLSMIELTHFGQHHYWDFPSLRSEKTKCTKEQLDAIDDLIDSMDLTIDPKDDKPRQTYESEFLAFNSLPHVFEKNMMDVLERKVIANAGEEDEEFQKLLADKNFVEKYWKVPEAIEENAKRAAKRVKALFPLERNTQARRVHLDIKYEKNNATGAIPKKAATDADAEARTENISEESPGEDFEKILKQNVLPLPDLTERDNKFHHYAKQMRSVLWNLIFTTGFLEMEKIANALFAYRKCCFDFNAFNDYNEWISDVKAALTPRKELHDFWRDVIVSKNLGLCFIGKPTVEEVVKMEDFYKFDFQDSGCDSELLRDPE